MVYLESNAEKSKVKVRFYTKRWFKVLAVVLAIFLLAGGIIAWKAGSVVKKISSGSILNSLVQTLPGVSNELKGEGEDRINVLLLGMRGENVPGGGLLADTIMLVSVKPKENKISMLSIPRDLYVNNPGWGNQSKINAVYAAGEENGKNQGLADMQRVVGEITGLEVHYAASINFAGFKQLIDAIGGIDINLEKPFEEAVQFDEPHVCDSYVFTEPTGKYENKTTITKSGRVRVVKSYPLCTNPNKECGGAFSLPAGRQTLNGDKALCYVRSRATSNDFERAKRQQQVIQLVKDKLLSAGTLTDFGKLNGILDSLGNNVRSDMQAWEMKRLYELYTGMQNPQVYQRVLENSEEGLLYNPTDMPKEVGYILLPIGDNYDRIRQMANDIFILPPQSDIKPK